MVSIRDLDRSSAPFLDYLEEWAADLPHAALADVLARPERCAVVSVDVMEGFCSNGPLASARVGAIVPPIAHLMTAAWERGLRHILLLQDTHDPQAVEFSAWPPHCVRGTDESRAAAGLRELPFYEQMVIMPKNSLSPNLHTGLEAWLAAHPLVDTFIVVGDCTDLCTYQLAMFLRMDANARQVQRRVIVPVDCVETFDLSVQAAQLSGGLPHPADLLSAVFLYHMALNGIEVTAGLG